MKTYILNLRDALSSISLALLMAAMLALASCGGDDESPACSGCTAASPWSKAGAGNCYADQPTCERAEGGTCVICN